LICGYSDSFPPSDEREKGTNHLSTPLLLPTPRAGDAIPAPASSAAALRARAARRPLNAVRQRCPPRARSAAALPAPPRWLSLAASRRCRIPAVRVPSIHRRLVSVKPLRPCVCTAPRRRSHAVRPPSIPRRLVSVDPHQPSAGTGSPAVRPRRHRDSSLPPSQTHLDHVSLAAPV
ncbi:Os07g0264000, partial [Oryza sativa Japonica Group]